MRLRPRSNSTILKEQGRMVELKIQLDDKGNINVNGPIANKVLCYGMLEMAKDAIKGFSAKQSPIIEVPAGTTVQKLHQ